MTPSLKSTFKQDYKKHLQHLKLKGLQPKTIEAYSRAIRREKEMGSVLTFQQLALS